MKINYLIAICFIMSLNVRGQKIGDIKKTLGPNYNKYAINDVKFAPEREEFTFQGINWKKGWLNRSDDSDGKTKIVQGVNIRGAEVSQPFVTVLKVKKSGEIVQTEEVPIHLSDVFEEISADEQYEINDYKSLMLWFTSEDARPLGELKAKYPGAFPAEQEDYSSIRLEPYNVAFSGPSLKKLTTEHEYDKWVDDYDEETVEKTISFEHAYQREYLSGEYLYDRNRKTILMPVKCQIEGRLSTYFNKHFYVVDSEGEVLSSTSIELDQPKRMVYLGGFGKEIGTSSFHEGAIVIYGRPRLSKKKNDPNLTRHYVVILDEAGTPISQSEFDLGVPKQISNWYASFKLEDRYFVFGRLIGKEKSGFVVLEFNEEGFVGVKNYSIDDLSNLLVGDVDTGLKRLFSRKFEEQLTAELPGGQILMAGDTYEEEKETLPAKEGESMGQSVTHKYYLGRVFLLFDRSGELISYYSSSRSGGRKKNPAELELVKYSDGQLWIQDLSSKELIVLNEKEQKVNKFSSAEKIYDDQEGTCILLGEWNAADKGKVVHAQVVTY